MGWDVCQAHAVDKQTGKNGQKNEATQRGWCLLARFHTPSIRKKHQAHAFCFPKLHGVGTVKLPFPKAEQWSRMGTLVACEYLLRFECEMPPHACMSDHLVPQLAVLFGEVMEPQDVETGQRVWTTRSRL